MAFQLISTREAESLMNHWEYVVIDLRNDRDYRKGHMQGALNLPYEFLDHYIEKLPKNRRYNSILYQTHVQCTIFLFVFMKKGRRRPQMQPVPSLEL